MTYQNQLDEPRKGEKHTQRRLGVAGTVLIWLPESSLRVGACFSGWFRGMCCEIQMVRHGFLQDAAGKDFTATPLALDGTAKWWFSAAS